MSDPLGVEPDTFAVAETFGKIHVFSRPVVWTAGLVIVALAGFGLFQGVRGAMSGGAGGGPGELTSGDAISAQAAAPLPQNTQWSTLSGPAMGPVSAAQKAAPAAAAVNTDDEDDDSAADDSAQAAAASAAPAVSAAPVAPVSTAPVAPTSPSTKSAEAPASSTTTAP